MMIRVLRRIYRDHPRSRGVYNLAQTLEALTKGSSPLARGLQTLDAYAVYSRGIIPARAGSTFLSPSFTHFRRDHPRSRGVY